MGGLAFSSHDPPLYTPRMPPSQYNAVCTTLLEKLSPLFTEVKTFIEAPEKADYGDVDMIVYEPLTPDLDLSTNTREQVCKRLAQILGATASITGPKEQIMQFAIPWVRENDSTQKSDSTSSDTPSLNDAKPKHFQLDLKICKDIASFNWDYFHSAHGDLWNILGSMIRLYGLTVNDKGLHVRIPEIEAFDRKKSMVWLSSEPDEILGFLGMDESRWFTSFETVGEMFEYATTCRMFCPKAESDPDISPQEVQKALKHSDRARFSKRPIFRQWIEEFLPNYHFQCPSQPLTPSIIPSLSINPSTPITRTQIRDDVFVQFSHLNIKGEWDSRLKEWLYARHMEELKKLIKSAVPLDVENERRAACIRELRAILEGERFEGVAVEAAKTNENGFYDLVKVGEFIEAHWKRVLDVAWVKMGRGGKK